MERLICDSIDPVRDDDIGHVPWIAPHADDFAAFDFQLGTEPLRRVPLHFATGQTAVGAPTDCWLVPIVCDKQVDGVVRVRSCLLCLKCKTTVCVHVSISVRVCHV